MTTFFDPKDKKNKPILDYFEDKTWLVVENSSSVRSSLKKTIVQLGARVKNMQDADNFADAKTILEKDRPQFFIGNKIINGGSSLELFDIHMRNSPNRLKSGFFIITEENSLVEVAIALEYEMDGIVSLPFTGATVINTPLKGIEHKLKPTPYLNKIEEGRKKYLEGHLDHALESFELAVNLNKNPYEGHYFIGQIHCQNQQMDNAIAAFEKSVSYNPGYYKSLDRLSSLYYQNKNFKKSYDTNLLLLSKYPTSPKKIPELIRLSIINQKYEDVMNYLKVFNTVESPSLETQNYVSAGMAVLGKYFVTVSDVEKGVGALRVAFSYSHGKYEILKSITQSFQEFHKLDALLELFEKMDLSVWPNEAQIFYFQTLHLISEDDQKVAALGESLLKNNVHDMMIYKGLMERGMKTKRNPRYFENLYTEAAKHLTEKRDEEFEHLYARAKGEA